MHKALNPRDDVDRLYVWRKEARRRFASIQDSVNASIQQLEDCVNRRRRRLIRATRNNPDNTSIHETKIIRKQKWEENNCMDTSSHKQVNSHSKNLDTAQKRKP